MRIKVIVLLSLFVLAAACKKRKYPEENVRLEKEEIFCDAFIDGEPVSLKIGSDGYYCYSSYKQPADSVYVFEGTLKKFDCDPCPRSLHLELSDFQPRLPGSSVPADLVFKTGSRGFAPALPRTSMVRFVSLSNKEVTSVRWALSNGGSSDDSVMTYEFAHPGPQTVSLTVTTKGNCESTVINKIYLSAESGLFACSIKAEPAQGTNSDFRRHIVGGKTPFRYTWSFGDGGTSDLPEPTHNYKYAGSYPVTLRIQDAENHICESSYIYVAGNDQSSCAANMSLSYTGSRNVSLNGVKIQWTDQSNAFLRSDNIVQPAGSYFEITDSQPYEANEKGEAGRLLTLRFNVLLSDGNRKLWFKSDNTAIAVTYK